MIEKEAEVAETKDQLLAPRLQDFVQEQLGDERSRVGEQSAIGIIRYSDKKKAAFLIQDALGKLTIVKKEFKDSFDFLLQEGMGRIVNLDSYDDLLIGQIELKGAKVATFRSVHSRPSVSILFNYKDPILGNNDKQREFTSSEEEFLKIFTGKGGGLIGFRGSHIPEEYALLIDRAYDKSKIGNLFFFHPEGDERWGVDSVQGLLEFLRTLNKEFVANASFPLQEKALANLEQEVNRGSLRFANEVRYELFKTMTIANVRLREGDRFLKEFFPGLYDIGWRNLARKMGLKTTSDKSTSADLLIDNLIINQESISKVKPIESGKQVTWDRIILDKLKTTRAIKLRSEIPSLKYGINNHEMRIFLRGLVTLVNTANSEQDFSDAEELLQELEARMNKVSLYYNLYDEQEAGINVYFYDYSLKDQEHKTFNIIHSLKTHLNERRKTVFYNT